MGSDLTLRFPPSPPTGSSPAQGGASRRGREGLSTCGQTSADRPGGQQGGRTGSARLLQPELTSLRV